MCIRDRILFALAGLLVVGKLPLWIVSLVVAAGVALGAILFLLRWLAKRRDPAYSPGRSLDVYKRQALAIQAAAPKKPGQRIFLSSSLDRSANDCSNG